MAGNMLSQLAAELIQSLDEEIDILKNPRGKGLFPVLSNEQAEK